MMGHFAEALGLMGSAIDYIIEWVCALPLYYQIPLCIVILFLLIVLYGFITWDDFGVSGQ